MDTIVQTVDSAQAQVVEQSSSAGFEVETSASSLNLSREPAEMHHRRRKMQFVEITWKVIVEKGLMGLFSAGGGGGRYRSAEKDT